VISEVEVLDENAASDYRRLAAASIADYGGRYLARGAKAEVVEGEPTERQIIIVEFSSSSRRWCRRASGTRRPFMPKRCDFARGRWTDD
jgi:uncharacterized protein (DUF1330 family)